MIIVHNEKKPYIAVKIQTSVENSVLLLIVCENRGRKNFFKKSSNSLVFWSVSGLGILDPDAKPGRHLPPKSECVKHSLPLPYKLLSKSA